jgi:hypothetical protein
MNTTNTGTMVDGRVSTVIVALNLSMRVIDARCASPESSPRLAKGVVIAQQEANQIKIPELTPVYPALKTLSPMERNADRAHPIR